MDEQTERLIRAGLQPPPQQQSQDNYVNIIIDGQQQQVPADVGTYMAVSNVSAVLQQLIVRLDAIHAHLAGRDHAKSAGRQKCLMCQADALTPEQIEELRQQVEAQRAEQQNQNGEAHAVDAVVHPSITQEEQEQE